MRARALSPTLARKPPTNDSPEPSRQAPSNGKERGDDGATKALERTAQFSPAALRAHLRGRRRARGTGLQARGARPGARRDAGAQRTREGRGRSNKETHRCGKKGRRSRRALSAHPPAQPRRSSRRGRARARGGRPRSEGGVGAAAPLLRRRPAPRPAPAPMATGTVLLKLQGVYFKVEATLREWDEANVRRGRGGSEEGLGEGRGTEDERKGRSSDESRGRGATNASFPPRPTSRSLISIAPLASPIRRRRISRRWTAWSRSWGVFRYVRAEVRAEGGRGLAKLPLSARRLGWFPCTPPRTALPPSSRADTLARAPLFPRQSLEEAAKEERTGAARAPPRSGRDADREAAPPRSPRPPPAATLLAAQLSALARSHLRATSDAAELASCADKLERLAREAAGAAALGAGAGARAAAGGKAKAGRGGKAGRAADGPRPLASPPPVRPPLRAGSAWAGDVRQLAESARLEATFRERLTLELVGWRNAEEAARARAAAALSPCFRAAEFRDGPLALMKAMGPKPKHAA